MNIYPTEPEWKRMLATPELDNLIRERDFYANEAARLAREKAELTDRVERLERELSKQRREED